MSISRLETCRCQGRVILDYIQNKSPMKLVFIITYIGSPNLLQNSIDSPKRSGISYQFAKRLLLGTSCLECSSSY